MIETTQAQAARKRKDAEWADYQREQTLSAKAMIFMLDQGLPADTGHGDEVEAPEGWADFDEGHRIAWCRSVVKRREANGLRAGRYAAQPLEASEDVLGIEADDPLPERVAEARDTLLTAVIMSDETDRETIRALSDVVGAIVVESLDPDVAANLQRNRARALRNQARWDKRSGLPRGALRSVAAALGCSPQWASKRLDRVRRNLRPLAEGIRLAGRLRTDARAGLV